MRRFLTVMIICSVILATYGLIQSRAISLTDPSTEMGWDWYKVHVLPGNNTQIETAFNSGFTATTLQATTVDAVSYTVSGGAAFSGVITNSSTLSTTLTYYASGLVTNWTLNP